MASRRQRRATDRKRPLQALLLTTGAVITGGSAWLLLSDAPAPSHEVVTTVAQPATPSGPTPVRGGTVDLDQPAPDVTGAPADSAVCQGCDILLITACSLRRDHVGVYGDFPELTPAADRIADGGYAFDRAFAASNFTLASLTAVLTGRFGSSSGVTGWDKGLGDTVPTLAEVLGIYGYTTGAFTIDAPSGFRPDYGLHRGFQTMKIIPTPRGTPDGRMKGGDLGEPGASAAPVEAWLSAQAASEGPLFTMFHTRTAHFPFVVTDDGADTDPTGITAGLWNAGRTQINSKAGAMPGMAGGTAQQGVVEIVGSDPLEAVLTAGGEAAEARWRLHYREAVARMDADVDRVLDALDASGRSDRTIVVLVGDHGESLGDHGEMLHGDAYYNSVVNVPLLIRVPGLDGAREPVSALVSHVDLLPTLLELVGAVPPADIDGASLVPVLRGDVPAVRSTTLVEGGVARQAQGVVRGAVISDRWALLRQQRGCGATPPGPGQPWEPEDCLFDHATDFAQDHNVAADHPEVVSELLARWKGFRQARAADARQLALDPGFVDELQRTGYDFGTPEPR